MLCLVWCFHFKLCIYTYIYVHVHIGFVNEKESYMKHPLAYSDHNFKACCGLEVITTVLSSSNVGETSNRFRFWLSNHKYSIKHNFSGYPVAMHFNEQSRTIEDLWCIIIRNHVPNMDNRTLIEQKTIIILNTHITGLNKDRFFIALLPLSCLHLFTER